ncbi:ATP-dependent endonuclease [Azospirillum sp. 11R-A]|uniref:ATP-dependent nuclease n=1 Tax=Azospirillum sp. 11R-A TaxID=3111634 RepID=UPI003C2253E2
MHIESLRIRNFRRLKDVRIDLASDISIFVGANNSGKTSAAQALQLFSAASRDRFSIHDFSVDCWSTINAFGDGVGDASLPAISLDIWFNVRPNDLHRVVDLLPSLAWQGNCVGLRVEFAAAAPDTLRANFLQARERAKENIRPGVNGGADYHPPPRNLCDYLGDGNSDRLRREFELRYYVLDRARFDDELRPEAGYTPLRAASDKGQSGRDILARLLTIDVLHAQRHLSDAAGGSRSEDLSRCLSRFYDRNLEKRGEDFEAQRALADSEAMLNDHLGRVFGPTLRRLAVLGYPGLNNPSLLIRTALNPATIMSSHEGARVHYALEPVNPGCDPLTLPDRYNGLGFKNLIYMVVELLGFHSRWLDIEENRPPLHLIFIEEPEAHLHAQLQQVFIRKVLDILDIDDAEADHYTSQIVVSTHSPHILYERGFRPIRYFRRTPGLVLQTSDVLNLSIFYQSTANPVRDFLERYLKLTHCDLFFADAAILVEGNVERLLLPQMIAKVAPRLQSACLSILEIGGAFGHRFRSLIEFLGITTLIVTDIDSVLPPQGNEDDTLPAEEAVSLAEGDTSPAGEEDALQATDEALEDEDKASAGSACMVHIDGALTSNQTLIQWLPGRKAIAELLAADEASRTQLRQTGGDALVRVTYQTTIEVTWSGQAVALAGRTLEEAFALENLVWCQAKERAELKLRIRGAAKLTPEEMAERLHSKIGKSSFHKTDFALALLACDPAEWTVPHYIASGLSWLEQQVTPPPAEPAPEPTPEPKDLEQAATA